MKKPLWFLASFLIFLIYATHAATLPSVKIAINYTFTATGNAATSPITLYTPVSAGEYRVSMYGESSAVGTIPANVIWTDDFSTFTRTNGCADQFMNATSFACESSIRIHVAADQPIQVSVTDQSVSGITQTFFVTVEKL